MQREFWKGMRDLLKILISNPEVKRKTAVIELSFPFSQVANRHSVPAGDPHRDIPRTFDRIIDILAAACTRGQLPNLSTIAGCGQPEAAPKKYSFQKRGEKES